MKTIIFFLLCLCVCICDARVTCGKIIVRAARMKTGDLISAVDAKGTFTIDCKTGAVTLIGTDKTTAATEFVKRITAFHEFAQKTKLESNGVFPTHVSIFVGTSGMYLINIKTGAVTWPGIATVDQATRDFWDQVVLEFQKVIAK